jgi:hypothetical protein
MDMWWANNGHIYKEEYGCGYGYGYGMDKP